MRTCAYDATFVSCSLCLAVGNHRYSRTRQAFGEEVDTRKSVFSCGGARALVDGVFGGSTVAVSNPPTHARLCMYVASTAVLPSTGQDSSSLNMFRNIRFDSIRV